MKGLCLCKLWQTCLLLSVVSIRNSSIQLTLSLEPPSLSIVSFFQILCKCYLVISKTLTDRQAMWQIQPCHAPYYAQLSCYCPTISLNCVSVSLLPIVYIFLVIFCNVQHLWIYLASIINNKDENKTILTSLLVFLTVKNKIVSENKFPKEVVGTSRWEKSIFSNTKIINPDLHILK